MAIRHIGSNKEEKLIHAKKCQDFMRLTKKNAERSGMKINTTKTKLLCISVSRNSNINAFVKADSQIIYGEDTLKMLGFVFGRHPNANAHVQHLTHRFYSRMWILRHLKAAGIAEDRLVQVYCCYMRPVIEYASNVYGCLLSEEAEERVEQLQRNALRVIYKSGKSYIKLREQAQIDTLKSRRTENFRKFSLKVNASDRFRNQWLTTKDHNKNTRCQEKYKITHAKWDRYKNGHLNNMKRILNS